MVKVKKLSIYATLFILIGLLIIQIDIIPAAKTEPRINGKIAFQSDRDGNFQIYSMNPDGSGQTRLTNNNDKEEHPSWSPDGTKIAFSSNHDGDWEIYVMRADGSELVKITNSGKESRPSWSPDGTKIAFESMRDGNLEIYIMNADGSAQTRLTQNSASDSYPRWSPDGTEVAFYSNRDGNWEIYVMNEDGSGQTRLTNNGYTDRYPSWSPDGSKIVFVSNRDGNPEIYVMNADGSGQTRLTNNINTEGPLSWSPDGAKIAFTSLRDGKWNIYIMNSDGSEETKLTSNAVGPEGDWWPVWQSLPLETATLTLQSSTSNTFTNTSFNLNATLSAPRSGTVTLYWSIAGSGFNYRENGTMTDGKYGRTFGATTPGVWAFKVVWAGDDQYQNATSNIITVTINPAPTMIVTPTASPATIYSGGASIIRTSVTSRGTALTGASLNLSSSNGGTFSTVVDNGNGTYVATFTAPETVDQTQCTITASASKSDYQSGIGQAQVAIQPLVLNIYVKADDGAPISGVALSSTSQPTGQTALTGSTDVNGQASFDKVQKGAYTFKATKTGYDDNAWTLTVKVGQATIESVALTRQAGSEGIPGYPLFSIVLAIVATVIILQRTKTSMRPS